MESKEVDGRWTRRKAYRDVSRRWALDAHSNAKAAPPHCPAVHPVGHRPTGGLGIAARARGGPIPRITRASQLGRELRNDLEEIADQPVVRNLEDRRLGVLVDRDDHLAVLHPGEMLDRTGDTDGDVKVRSHNLARLPDLIVVGHVARIDRRTRG